MVLLLPILAAWAVAEALFYAYRWRAYLHFDKLRHVTPFPDREVRRGNAFRLGALPVYSAPGPFASLASSFSAVAMGPATPQAVSSCHPFARSRLSPLPPARFPFCPRIYK